MRGSSWEVAEAKVKIKASVAAGDSTDMAEGNNMTALTEGESIAVDYSAGKT